MLMEDGELEIGELWVVLLFCFFCCTDRKVCFVSHVSVFVCPGDIIRYKCHPGFSLVGSEILTCRLGERLQMDASPPTCQGVFVTWCVFNWDIKKLMPTAKKRTYKWCIHMQPFGIVCPTVQCPAHDVRYDSSGVILSPGWPESYPNLQMCSWSVTVEKGYNVTITFESFHTEKEFDVLEIFDGNTENTHRH